MSVGYTKTDKDQIFNKAYELLRNTDAVTLHKTQNVLSQYFNRFMKVSSLHHVASYLKQIWLQKHNRLDDTVQIPQINCSENEGLRF